jgi:hypothetical protein
VPWACDIPIAASPADVRAWWIDVPTEWIVGREDGALLLETRFGAFRVRERLVLEGASGWRFETRAPFGLDVTDSFDAQPAPGGTRLRISLALRGRNAMGRLIAPMYRPIARRQFERRWRETAALCERDCAA